MFNWKKFVYYFSVMYVFSLQANSMPSKYIWNLGLAIECDITPFKYGLPEDYITAPPFIYNNPRNYIKNVKDGDLIWVQSLQLADFYYDVLPTITCRFSLLINDSDAGFPSSFYNQFDISALLRDHRLVHIYTQNMDSLKYLGMQGVSNKVSAIPIGIDFHTVAHPTNCFCFGENQQSVLQQEVQLEAILGSLLPTSQRIKKAYVDFQFGDRGVFDGESRTSIFNRIYPTGLIDAPSAKMPRHLLWQKKGEYAFSISPRGAGLDCHRTWEDLVLGCIVIVKTSPLDFLYEGLPVVIVNDWSEINQDNFDKWLVQYSDAFTNPDYRKKLTHQYWKNIIHSYKQQL
jgi:hypothetical protein